jgi:hypothetical protein
MNIVVTLEVAQGAKPKRSITKADSTKPIGRKYREFERSETRPMRNLDRPYAMATADRAVPSSPRL